MSSCYSVLGFQFLLSLGNVLDYVLGSRLDCLIRILRSLRLGLGLEMGLFLVGGAAFFAGAVGLGLDEDANSSAGVLAKRPCLSLGREMVAICGDLVKPGVCYRPFKEQGGVPIRQGQGRRRVTSSLSNIKGLTQVLVKKCNLLRRTTRFPNRDLAIL